MRKHLLSAMLVSVVGANIPPAFADLITFDFTGRMTIAAPAPNNEVIDNADAAGLIDEGGYQTPISATLTFNTQSGIGSSNLQITLQNLFLGQPATIHDVSFAQQFGTNLLDGTILMDWGGYPGNMSPYSLMASIQWDASGMINAINYGLQPGDKISGTKLYRDYNQDGQHDISEMIVADLGSAIPYTDTGFHLIGSTLPWYPNQGPAPMATTADTAGFLDPEAPFWGFRVFLDIGSGNSMYVTSVHAVPLPAAVWLFGTGLLGIVGLARRRK